MRYPILALISIGNRTILNCVSPLRGRFSVKIERFQIKSNVFNLISSLLSLATTFYNIKKLDLLRPRNIIFKYTLKCNNHLRVQNKYFIKILVAWIWLVTYIIYNLACNSLWTSQNILRSVSFTLLTWNIKYGTLASPFLKM